MEQINYNLLYHWFVGLSIDDEVWSDCTFSENRDRLLEHEVIPALLGEVVELARQLNWPSEERCSAEGTLIQAWVSQKSFRRGGDDEPRGRGRNRKRDFHGEQRLNDTHVSSSDPDARSYKKSLGGEARMSYLGHTLMENRHGLIVDARISLADGYGERETALAILADLSGSRRKTVGADKNYVFYWHMNCRELPHRELPVIAHVQV